MILTVTKKTIIVVTVIIALAAVCFVGMTNADVISVYNNKALRKVPVYCVDRADKQVALTFDAAWGADKTLEIIKILQRFDIQATFFLVGFWIDKFKDETKAIAESGCDIGNHSNNHLKMSTLSEQEVNSEIDYVNNIVNELTGQTPKFFRAPFGDYNNRLLDAVESKGMTGIQWDVDSLDWKGLSGAEILSRVNKGVKSGSIILFHNNSDNILEALPMVITNLLNQGYKPVKMSELVYGENYYMDNNGVQHRKE